MSGKIKNRKIFQFGDLLFFLTITCTCLNAQNLCIGLFLICMSCCNMRLLYAYLCEGQNVRLQQCGARMHTPGKNSKIKSGHIFTRSICGNQAAGKAEEYEEAEELQCQLFTNLSLSQPRRSSWSFWAAFSSSDSMAARLSIS